MRYRSPVCVSAIVLLSMVSFAGLPAGATQASTTTADTTAGDAVQQVDSPGTCDYQQLYNETIGSVVLIQTQDGLGSGFVYEQTNGSALVVTNEHVVGDHSQVSVTFSRSEGRSGTVLGATALTDLAVVRVDGVPDYVQELPLAESTPVPGEYVAAIGSPYGLERTITSGIVSGVNRSMPTEQGFSIPSTVQTDAPINPGNSGGPLVSCEDGTVLGVNRAGGSENIGFAVSAPIIDRVVPALVENGTVNYAFLAVSATDVSPPIAQANDLNTTEGVLVVSTMQGTNTSQVLQGADRIETVAGQRVPVGGDVVVGVEGTPVDSREDLVSYLLTETQPGESVELTVIRDGERQSVSVTLGERPEPDPGPA